MNKLFFSIIVALALISGSCKKDSNGEPATKMTCSISGTTWNSSVRVTQLVDHKFYITGTSLDGKIINITINGDTQGTYQTQLGQIGFIGTYKATTSASYDDIYAAVSGTVVLSNVDATNKTISGTFQFSALKPADMLNPISITNGQFNNLSYNEY